MSKKTDHNSYNIIIKDINIIEILQKYYFDKNEEDKETIIQFGKTPKQPEIQKKTKRNVMFLDPHRNQVNYGGIMIDITLNGPLPVYTTKPCWFCRN